MKTLPKSILALSLTLASCGMTPEAGDEEPQGNQVTPAAETSPSGSALYGLSADTLAGEMQPLAEYQGKVTLVVNVASECGYTRQYSGLQTLHAELKDRGFAVLGFPSNEFGGQEPGSAEEIQQFCTSKYGVTFPMFAKVATKNGDAQSPVYKALTTAAKKQPNWNFCKYLVGKDGEVIGFYPSSVAPASAELRAAIETALSE